MLRTNMIYRCLIQDPRNKQSLSSSELVSRVSLLLFFILSMLLDKFLMTPPTPGHLPALPLHLGRAHAGRRSLCWGCLQGEGGRQSNVFWTAPLQFAAGVGSQDVPQLHSPGQAGGKPGGRGQQVEITEMFVMFTLL